MGPEAIQTLDVLLDSVVECFTPEVARRLTNLQVKPALQARLAELAEKANEGLLTNKERDEYAAYVEAGDLIGILQAKARDFLDQQDR
jgi:hypothetical protein